MRKSTGDESNYELEVWTKGILRDSGKRRIDIIARIVEDESKDQECEVYKTLLEDIKLYLYERHSSNSKYLPIPKYFKSERSDFQEYTEPNFDSKKATVFMIEDVKNLGFLTNVVLAREGLDYEHSILGVAALARLHASSYCFRKEKTVAMEDSYPVLEEELMIPTVSGETMSLIEKIFQQTAGYEKYSPIFLAAARGELANYKTKLDCFGVFCHGLVLGENILFKYKNQLDSTLSCVQAMFQDLSSCHYGSCVLDLLQLIFASFNTHVRQNFLADLVCSVFCDNFAKTVGSINGNIPMFSKKQFIKEFDSKIMYGFVFSLDILSSSYLRGVDSDPSEEISDTSCLNFKMHFLALVNAKATLT